METIYKAETKCSLSGTVAEWQAASCILIQDKGKIYLQAQERSSGVLKRSHHNHLAPITTLP